MRILLSSYLDGDALGIKFAAGPYGKPYLEGEWSSSNLMFNVSTTTRMAILAVTLGAQLGIDLEEIISLEPHIEQSLSEREQTDLRTLRRDERTRAFYKCWTRKEAILKAEGIGLSVPLCSFDVSLLPDQQPQLLDARPAAKLTHRWWLSTADPNDAFCCALATEIKPTRIECFRAKT
jgi:4'-phosphopantetheinyl transferase